MARPPRWSAWNAIPDDRMVVDVGPRTVAAIEADLASAGTVVWNGPLGIYEVEAFARGTRAVARALGEQRRLQRRRRGRPRRRGRGRRGCGQIDFISTGGGATLEFLEGRSLPGVAALLDRPAVAP